jgi:hypothetical protein
MLYVTIDTYLGAGFWDIIATVGDESKETGRVHPRIKVSTFTVDDQQHLHMSEIHSDVKSLLKQMNVAE